MSKLKFGIYFVLASVLLWGCDDLFDVSPATSLPGEQVLTSADGVDALRASLYSSIRSSGSYTTLHFIAPSSFTDELLVRPGATRYDGYNFAQDGDGSRAHITSWNATYDIVQDANLMIGAVDVDADEMAPETVERYQGEAYAIRAFAYHNLVRVMGYDPGNFDQGPEGNWDHGIVLETDPVQNLDDVDDELPRASVNDVYDQIRSDLDNAKQRLAGVTERRRMNEAFVDGLRARVELYAGNWDEAEAAAAEAKANFGGSLEDDQAGIDVMFNEGEGDHPEAIFLLTPDPNTEPIAGSNVNNGPAAYTSDQWGAQLPTQTLLDRYEEGDYRLGGFILDDEGEHVIDEQTGQPAYEGWFEPCYNRSESETFSNCGDVNDEGFTITKWNGFKGNLADDLPYMRLSELYLIRAEAAAKAGAVADGVPYLNELREARGVDALDAGDFGNIEDFEDEILDERSRELVAEGHRFYDLKRLGRAITFPDGSTKFRADSHRILGPIPTSELSVNDALLENPGY